LKPITQLLAIPLVFISLIGVTQGSWPATTPIQSPTPNTTIIPTAFITPSPNPTQTSSTTVYQQVSTTATPTPWRPNPVSDYNPLIHFCNQTKMDSLEWWTELNKLIIPTDVSVTARDHLPFDMRVRPSCNFEQVNNPRAIVLHYTEGSLDASIATFQKPNSSSAHYIIDRDGSITQLVPERFAAFHVTCHWKLSLCNPSCPVCSNQEGLLLEPRYQTIGIELVNLGHIDPQVFANKTPPSNILIFEDYNDSFGYRFWEDYPPAQIKSLQILVRDVQKRWNIPDGMIIGHSRISFNVDPGPALNLFWIRYGNPSKEPVFKTP
jgi:N-acetyl-anhydromuramyl-L-alanine amidase AmpD